MWTLGKAQWKEEIREGLRPASIKPKGNSLHHAVCEVETGNKYSENYGIRPGIRVSGLGLGEGEGEGQGLGL